MFPCHDVIMYHLFYPRLLSVLIAAVVNVVRVPLSCDIHEGSYANTNFEPCGYSKQNYEIYPLLMQQCWLLPQMHSTYNIHKLPVWHLDGMMWLIKMGRFLIWNRWLNCILVCIKYDVSRPMSLFQLEFVSKLEIIYILHTKATVSFRK